MVEVWFFRVSYILFSKKILNRVGDSRQLFHTPIDVRKKSPFVSLTITAHYIVYVIVITLLNTI